VTGTPALSSAEKALDGARADRDAFLQVTTARARRDAARAHERPGPLAGTPFAVKDVFDVRGTRTSGASAVHDHRPPALRDAEAVRRLTAAGAVLVGKTTMSELAYSGLGVNDRFGTPTVTVAGTRRLVGGSSSGSAAAVRAGIVPLALGSDTSGSARIPAAWTGVFGYRPTIGRYPSAGMLALAPTLDTVGVLAASLALVDAADLALTGGTVSPAAREEPQFVVPHDDYLAGCDQVVLERFHQAVRGLRAQGRRITQQRFPSLDTARRLHRSHLAIVEVEALTAFGPHLDQTPERLTPAVRRRLERARTRLREPSARPLYEAMARLRDQFRRELGDRLLISPPAEIDAPALNLVRSDHDAHDQLNSRALRLTMVLSYLDAPSLVLPTGAAGGGARTAVQVSGSSGRDRSVLGGAAYLEPAGIETRVSGSVWTSPCHR
jgi:aspartyl-tRNA(Asn)/glutamyl-tRNA(Gln) amidotransferase subunit A